MRFEKFAIEFENSLKIYYPGQIVKGRIIISSDRERQIQGITLKTFGTATVSWWENLGKENQRYPSIAYHSNPFDALDPILFGHHNLNMINDSNNNNNNRFQRGFMRNRQNMQIISKQEIYIDHQYFIIGNGENFTLSSGFHEYPFSIVLPHGIPSSFKSLYGIIQYCVRCEVKQSWKFDISTEEIIIIKGLLDLNACSIEAKLPRGITREKDLYCLFCQSGRIGFHFRISKTGYVIGETLRFNSVISNKNSKPISTRVELLQETIYFGSDGRSKSTLVKKNRINGPSILSGNAESWDGAIEICQKIPPTDLGGCRIIQLNYFVNIVLESTKKIILLSGKHNILIGTTQLQDSSSNNNTIIQQPQPLIGQQQEDDNNYSIVQSRYYPNIYSNGIDSIPPDYSLFSVQGQRIPSAPFSDDLLKYP